MGNHSQPVGPDIQKDIAKGTARVLQDGLSVENKKQLREKYEHPNNCPRLIITTCNNEVLRKLKNTSMT